MAPDPLISVDARTRNKIIATLSGPMGVDTIGFEQASNIMHRTIRATKFQRGLSPR